MADLEELVVRIKADASALEREMKKAQGVVQQSSSGMQSALKGVADQARMLLPALTAAAVISFGRSALKSADHINDLALRTGFAGSTLSSLNIKLLQTGTSLDDFSASMNRMNNLIGEAAKPGAGKEVVKAFDDLGLSVRKLQTLSPEDQFFAIAEALGETSNQATFTNSGMAIFGRSFSSLGPIIKETKGHLKEFSDEQKRLGNALTEEELKRIDEWGDRWTSAIEHAKLLLVDYLDYFYRLGRETKSFFKDLNLPPNASFTRPKDLSDEEAARMIRDSARKAGLPNVPDEPKPKSARGGNAALLNAQELQKARQALGDFNRELQHQHEFAGMAPRDAAAQKVYYDTLELAQKAGVKNAEALAHANAEVARSTYDMNQTMAESARFAEELKDQFAETAGSIMRDSKNAGDALKRLGDALADMISKRYILGPLADQLFGSPGASGGGLLGGLFKGGGMSQLFDNAGAYLGMNSAYGPNLPQYAEGGNPPVGSPYMVGENGPEIRIDRRPGTIIPNNAIGGTSVTVQQNMQIYPGVDETVTMRIREAAPIIAAQAQQGVFAAIQKGGREAKIVNRRN